jgi:AcrR family transcriptional regulator
MPKAFTELEKETIRAQLRAKSTKLFEKHGVRKTSVDEITEAVGISKGAFYLFYESKEELLLEILEGIEKDIQTSILNIVVHPKHNAAQNISAMLKSMLMSWEAHPLLKSFGQSDFEYLSRKLPAKRLQKHAQSDKEFVNEFIKKMGQEGITTKVPPADITNLIKSLFLLGLHREDLGEENYQGTMNILVELVARHITGE